LNVNGKGSRWERGWTDVKEEEEECVFNTIISLAAIAALVLPRRNIDGLSAAGSHNKGKQTRKAR